MNLRKIKLLNEYSVIKTIIYNIKYLNFKTAMKLPIIVGKKSKILGKGSIIIKNPSKKIIIDKKSKITIYGSLIVDGRIHIGKSSGIYIDENGILRIGDNVRINSNLSLNCYKEIGIGSNSLISWNCTILDCDFHKIYDSEDNIINSNQSIYIGDKVWVGNNVTILKGVKVHNNCIIGAGSVVSNSTNEENCIYAGVPIKKIRTKIKWEY